MLTYADVCEREQYVEFEGREQCLEHMRQCTAHENALVRRSAAVVLGQLAKGCDTTTLGRLVDLKFDADRAVVECCVQASLKRMLTDAGVC